MKRVMFRAVLKKYGKALWKSPELTHLKYAESAARGQMGRYAQRPDLSIVNSVDHPHHFWNGEVRP